MQVEATEALCGRETGLLPEGKRGGAALAGCFMLLILNNGKLSDNSAEESKLALK